MAAQSSTAAVMDRKDARSRSASPDRKSGSASPRTQKADARSRNKLASETPWYLIEARFADVKPITSTVDAKYYAIPLPKTMAVKTFKTKEECEAHIRLIASGEGCKNLEISPSFHAILSDEEKVRHLLHVIGTTGISRFGEYIDYPVNRECGMIDDGKVGGFALARFCGYQPPVDAKPNMDSVMIDRVQFFSSLKAATDAASECALMELKRLAEELGETDEEGKVVVNPFGPFAACLKDDGTISLSECEKFGGVSTVARELGWMYWQVARVEEYKSLVASVSAAASASAH